MRCLQRLYLSPRNSMTQISLAHRTFSPHARSRSRAAGLSAGSIDEPCHWRLETFSRSKESDRMAGGHRLRDDERGEQLQAKVNCIRQNPVVAGLCADARSEERRVGKECRWWWR